MKLRKYEKTFALYLGILLFFICFVFFLLFLIFGRHFCYINFNGVVSNENVIFMVSSDQINYFYNNANLINDAKVKKFSIEKVHKNILKKDGQDYHEVIVKFNFSKKYKDNDVLNISLKKEKERLIDIFKIIWKEE